MLNRRPIPAFSRRCRAPLIPLGIVALSLLAAGCDQPPKATAGAATATLAAITPSPYATALATAALPPPPKITPPHPTRDEMEQMRKALDGPSGADPNQALRLAEAMGDLERVEALYQSLNKSALGNTMLQYRLADIYHRRLKIAEARKIYLELNRADPESPVNYLGLSDLERIQGRHSAMRKYLEKGVAAIKKGPNEAKYLLMYAERYAGLKDKKAQERTLRKALAAAPNASDVLLAMAKFCKDNNRGPEARQILDSLVAREPENIEAKRRLAALIAEHPQGAADVERGGKLLVELFQSGKMVPDDYMIMGQLMEQDSDWAKAGEAYIALVNVNPEHPEAYYRLARIYQKLGQTAYGQEVMQRHRKQREEEEQRGDLARLRQLSQLKPQVHLKEAQFAEKTRDYRIAVIAYGLAARLAPKDPKIRQAREKFYRFLGWPPPNPEK